MFSRRRKAPRECGRRKHLGGSGGMLPQEIFKIELLRNAISSVSGTKETVS